MHADRNAQDGGQRQHIRPDMPVTQGAMVGAPVGHHRIHITEGPLSGEIGHKVMCGPGGIGAFVDLLVNVCGQVDGPNPRQSAIYRPKAFDQVQRSMVRGMPPRVRKPEE